MFFKLHVHRGRRGEPKTFAWCDYRDFIRMVHLQLGTPVVWVWDNLSVHLQQEKPAPQPDPESVPIGAGSSLQASGDASRPVTGRTRCTPDCCRASLL
ncbi:hypothetical protein [Streptomyces coerulescens]|uniref:Transposase n=1 Tax=Streptomyces coerulescens TaxID=29304 RepID=A0ABW0CSV6_STRCD